MILSKRIESLLMDQYNAEVQSALLYRNIAGFYDDRYFPGIAKFFMSKCQEEFAHSQKFYDYLNLRDSRAVLNESAAQGLDFSDIDLVTPFVESLKHEQEVTENINQIFRAAREENDYPTEEFLHWFIQEQLHEEEEFMQLINEAELSKGDGGDMLKLDKKLGELANGTQQ